MAEYLVVILRSGRRRMRQKEHMRVLRRMLRDSENPFDAITDEHFKELYRFPKVLCLDLIETLKPFLGESSRRHAIPSHIKVLSALRFFACGSFQRAVGQDNLSPISQSSVSRCIRETSKALCKIAHLYVKFPAVENFPGIKRKFFEKHNFPGIVGLIDGTHIKITAPRREVEHVYYCRKGGHSKNVMIICDADYLILSASAQFGGSAHDSYVWRWSEAYQKIREMYAGGLRDFWLLGDSGYPLQPWLLTPISVPSSDAEENYNISHKKTRSIVERCIGVLKSRCRCLSKERALYYPPRTSAIIIYACIVLHNVLIRARVPIEEYLYETIEDNNEIGERLVDDHLREGQKQRSSVVRSAFSN